MPAKPKATAELGLGEKIEEWEKRKEWTPRREEAKGKNNCP